MLIRSNKSKTIHKNRKAAEIRRHLPEDPGYRESSAIAETF